MTAKKEKIEKQVENSPVETPDFVGMTKDEETPEKPRKRYKKKQEREKEKAAEFEKTVMDVKGLFQMANGFLFMRRLQKWMFTESEIDTGAPIVGRLIEKYLPAFGKYADETAFLVFIASYAGSRLFIPENVDIGETETRDEKTK